MICPNCGDLIKDENALFCPYCANRLNLPTKRTGYQIAAAVLTIVAACLAVPIGLVGLTALLAGFGRSAFLGTNFYLLVVGFFSLLSFTLGLTSALFTLRRRHFWWSIIGISFVLASGIANFLLGAIGSLFGMPTVFFAFLALVSAAVSRNEYV